MDDNTRQVAIAAITVGATLAGIWLGWLLQGRRRYDADRRDAYATLLGLLEQMRHRADTGTPLPANFMEDLSGVLRA